MSDITEPLGDNTEVYGNFLVGQADDSLCPTLYPDPHCCEGSAIRYRYDLLLDQVIEKVDQRIAASGIGGLRPEPPENLDTDSISTIDLDFDFDLDLPLDQGAQDFFKSELDQVVQKNKCKQKPYKIPKKIRRKRNSSRRLPGKNRRKGSDKKKAQLKKAFLAQQQEENPNGIL